MDPRGHFVDYLLNHPKVKGHWHDYTHHDFVNQLGAGTLDKECFKHYLMQDYLFLVSCVLILFSGDLRSYISHIGSWGNDFIFVIIGTLCGQYMMRNCWYGTNHIERFFGVRRKA